MFKASQFGMRPNMLPALGVIVQIPDPFVDSTRGKKLHHDVAKDSIREVLGWHNQSVMGEHFKQSNRGKYGYQERRPSTKRRKRKRYGSITDMKKTGRSAAKMTSQRPRVSFRQETPDGIVHGYMRYRWAFPRRRERPTKGIDQRDLNEEVTRWTQSESVGGADRFGRAFADSYTRRIANSKKYRKIITPQL